MKRQPALALVSASSLLLATCTDDVRDDGGTDVQPAPASTSFAVDAGTIENDPDDSAVEVRQHIGPRAFDHTTGTMIVLDSLEVDGDDIFVRMRVVNGSEEFLDLGVRDTLYGPLAVMTDDLDNSYPAVAVEPTGIDVWSVGDLRLRLQGPFDPNANDFTLHLDTARGPLVSSPAPAPRGDAVSWWLEQRRKELDEPIVARRGDRTMHVTEVVDHGSHVGIAVAIDGSADEVVADTSLTDADGTEFTLIPFEPASPASTDAASAVLRFVGPYGTARSPVRLTVGGIDVKIPSSADAGTSTTLSRADAKTPTAASPRLSDLLHMWLTDEPLDPSIITGQ